MSAVATHQSVVVPHDPRGARLARHRLAADLARQVTSEMLADAVAVAAELVGNAVRHARPLPGGVVCVSWRLTSTGDGWRHIVISVVDGGAAGDPRIRDAAPEAVDGRGLAIVAALAYNWGAERDHARQVVWAELRGGYAARRSTTTGMPRHSGGSRATGGVRGGMNNGAPHPVQGGPGMARSNGGTGQGSVSVTGPHRASRQGPRAARG